MRTSTALICATTLVFCGASPSYAEDLTIRLPDPSFTISIPGLSKIEFSPHPSAAQNPSARLLGSNTEDVNVSVLTPKAEGASAQQCASWLVGSTISRYAPDLAALKLFPSGPNAWVLIYPFKAGPIEQLKAHVFSGNGKGQCLEVHISRIATNEQQRQAWFSGFQGISVVAE